MKLPLLSECATTNDVLGWGLAEQGQPTSDELIKRFIFRIAYEAGKVEKLKRLLLLTDPDVSDVVMNDLTMRQWDSFCKEFPEEKQ